MLYRFEPSRPIGAEAKRVACECLDDALSRIDGLTEANGAEIEAAVHEVRKRCKEVRGLARLVRPALGDSYSPLNTAVRDAARELSTVRDAHAQLVTIESVQDRAGSKQARRLEPFRTRQAAAAEAASASLDHSDARLRRATTLLISARAMVEIWELGDTVEAIDAGIDATYRRGRSRFKRLRKHPNDERAHEWRKAVKYLWYQVRLLESADEGSIGPLVDQLDELSDLLGDDHDLAVFVAMVESEPHPEVSSKVARQAVRLARDRQTDLRSRALELGDAIFTESASTFVDRVIAPWRTAVETRSADETSHNSVERERKFLVTTLPPLPDDGVRISQGYIALDGDVEVRVRSGDALRTLAVKGGQGRVRTELEWRIGKERFDAAWKLTRGRTIDKVRYGIPIGGGTAELDVFQGPLEGLVVVEVEFDTDASMEAFEPPDWFGTEVTDDPRYSNASLAVDGLPGARRSTERGS